MLRYRDARLPRGVRCDCLTAFDTFGYSKTEDWDGTANNGLYEVEISVVC